MIAARPTGLVLLVVLGLAATGCDSTPRVEDRDLERARTVYRAGLESSDPYVRAETLRVMEWLERRDLPADPATFVEDDHPMVRVAALRVLLATGARDAEGLALNRFTSGPPDEKGGILEAVLEYGSEDFQRRLVWRALGSSQPRTVRHMAVRDAVARWVREAIENGDTSVIERQLAANARKYVRQLDPEIGGRILQLLLRLEKTDAPRRSIETLEDPNASVDERLRAAEVLLDARAEAAVPAFRNILEKARDRGQGDTLEVPEEGPDERLVRRAVLGVVAQGNTELVSKAKTYLEGASPDVYIEVLEGLAPNPTEDARLALENALIDPRPRIRHRAIELYAGRDDAELSALLDVALDESFSKQEARTHRRVARALGRNFSPDWATDLENNLQSSEGVRPALRLLRDHHGETGRPDAIEAVREPLSDLATADDGRPAALAGYLLLQLPEGPGGDPVTEAIASLRDPQCRYAYLLRLVEGRPSDHVGELRANFYPEQGEPESYVIRMISGVGLWVVRHPAQPPSTETDTSS